MAKIKPVISKVSKRNIYEYFDSNLNTNIKVCGFDIYVYDNISKDRIRKRIRADYKTVALYVEKLEKDITDISLKLNNNHILPHMTLSTFLGKFKSEKSKLSDRVGKGLAKESIRRYETTINSIIKYIKKDILFSSLTEHFIEKWIVYRKNSGISVNTINTDLRHLKAMFKWGMKSNLINENPINEIAPFKGIPKTIRVLTEDDLNSIWEVCKPDSRWYPYIVVYLLTGARISEILKPKLKWEDVDFDRNTISLLKRKRGKRTIMPLTNALKSVLLKVKEQGTQKRFHTNEDEDYVFPFSPSYISRKLKKDVFIPAKLEDVTVHDLRRSFASHLASLGFEIYDVSQIMAHSKIDVTQTHYLTQLPSKTRKMLEELEKHLGLDSEKVLEKSVGKVLA